MRFTSRKPIIKCLVEVDVQTCLLSRIIYLIHYSENLCLLQNIDYGFTLELPGRGSSNEYPQSMFLIKNKKNLYTPLNPVLL